MSLTLTKDRGAWGRAIQAPASEGYVTQEHRPWRKMALIGNTSTRPLLPPQWDMFYRHSLSPNGCSIGRDAPSEWKAPQSTNMRGGSDGEAPHD